jgi:hypothetical protein
MLPWAYTYTHEIPVLQIQPQRLHKKPADFTYFSSVELKIQLWKTIFFAP